MRFGVKSNRRSAVETSARESNYSAPSKRFSSSTVKHGPTFPKESETRSFPTGIYLMRVRVGVTGTVS